MTEYGQVINPNYDPSKNYVYEAFSRYFNNPELTKIKNVDKYSMYAIKIHAMLGNAIRYLIIFIDRDVNPIGFKKPMGTCDWVSLQTRTLEDIHDVPTHFYKAEKKPPLDQVINVKNRDKDKSVYNAEKFPLEITLLHTRKNHMYQYHPTGSIVSALETFQTIINFKQS